MDCLPILLAGLLANRRDEIRCSGGVVGAADGSAGQFVWAGSPLHAHPERATDVALLGQRQTGEQDRSCRRRLPRELEASVRSISGAGAPSHPAARAEAVFAATVTRPPARPASNLEPGRQEIQDRIRRSTPAHGLLELPLRPGRLRTQTCPLRL